MTFSERVKKILSSVWGYIKAAWIELTVFAGVLVLDLVTKAVIDATMSVGQSIDVIPKFFSLSYTHNYNAAFGSAFGLENVLGKEGVRVALLVVTGIAIVFFSVFLVRTKGKHITGRLGLAMLVSGALGNFIDRLFLGYVRDFCEIIYFGLDLPWLGTSFAIFNIADVGVTVGVVLFLVYIVFFSDFGKEKSDDKKTKSEYVLLDSETGKPSAGESDGDNNKSDGDTEVEAVATDTPSAEPTAADTSSEPPQEETK